MQYYFNSLISPHFLSKFIAVFHQYKRPVSLQTFPDPYFGSVGFLNMNSKQGNEDKYS